MIIVGFLQWKLGYNFKQIFISNFEEIWSHIMIQMYKEIVGCISQSLFGQSLHLWQNSINYRYDRSNVLLRMKIKLKVINSVIGVIRDFKENSSKRSTKWKLEIDLQINEGLFKIDNIYYIDNQISSTPLCTNLKSRKVRWSWTKSRSLTRDLS